MSIEWVNVYLREGKDYPCEFLVERRPEDAQFYSVMPQNSPTFLRVEMRINGRCHRPPVGMSASQASHRWSREPYYSLTGLTLGKGRAQLVPR